MPDSPAKKNRLDPGLGFMAIGSELVAFTVTGVLVDYWLGTSPWWTVGLTLAGVAAAVLLALKLLRMEDASRDLGQS